MTDIRCFDDADPYMSETTSALEELEQDEYHVLTQDEGANPDDVTRGINLPALLSGVFDRSIEHAAETEAGKDQRCLAAKAHLSTEGTAQSGVAATIDIEIQPDDATLGPITITIPGP